MIVHAAPMRSGGNGIPAHGGQFRFSDSPGTNASRYFLNPMLGLYAAVTRKTLSGQPEGGWFPQEKADHRRGDPGLYTEYCLCRDSRKTSRVRSTVGKLADFVVLSDNLLTMDPDQHQGRNRADDRRRRSTSCHEAE